jgi:hypothetical protein
MSETAELVQAPGSLPTASAARHSPVKDPFVDHD